MRGEILYLTRRDLYPNCLHDEPLIHQGHSISEEEVCHVRGSLETWGDVLIQGLWESQTEAIIEVRLGESDCDTHKKDPTKTLLDWWKKENKDKQVNNNNNLEN